MKALVFSDSHGRRESMLEITQMLADDVTHIFHLGDNTEDCDLLRRTFPSHIVFGVAGNCDFAADFELSANIEINGKRIFITHGHRYSVKHSLYRLLCAAKENQADIALYGHTHIADITGEDGILLMNPGSIALPRGREYKSYGILDIAEDGTISASVVEVHQGTYKIIHSN